MTLGVSIGFDCRGGIKLFHGNWITLRGNKSFSEEILDLPDKDIYFQKFFLENFFKIYRTPEGNNSRNFEKKEKFFFLKFRFFRDVLTTIINNSTWNSVFSTARLVVPQLTMKIGEFTMIYSNNSAKKKKKTKTSSL